MLPENRQRGYLQECLSEFPAICRLKYGIEFDFAAVEKRVEHHRCRAPLTCDDLQHFDSRIIGSSDFGRFHRESGLSRLSKMKYSISGICLAAMKARRCVGFSTFSSL